jgi:hypothetical protein
MTVLVSVDEGWRNVWNDFCRQLLDFKTLDRSHKSHQTGYATVYKGIF